MPRTLLSNDQWDRIQHRLSGKTSDLGVTAKEAVNLRQPLTITSPQSGYSKASRIVATPDYQKNRSKAQLMFIGLKAFVIWSYWFTS